MALAARACNSSHLPSNRVIEFGQRVTLGEA